MRLQQLKHLSEVEAELSEKIVEMLVEDIFNAHC